MYVHTVRLASACTAAWQTWTCHVAGSTTSRWWATFTWMMQRVFLLVMREKALSCTQNALKHVSFGHDYHDCLA
jgi:hypothetical protein